MKKNFLKKLVLLTCVASLGLATPGMSAYAASSISIDLTKNYASSRFYYGQPGHQLKLEMEVSYYDSVKRKVLTKIRTTVRNGSCVDVYDCLKAKSTEEFFIVLSSGYVDGAVRASLLENREL